MTLRELDTWFNSFLKKEDFAADISLNGIQIENSKPDEKEIKKIAFAVDACEKTAKIAAENGADLLFVHHGLFWGHCQTITGSFYKRISAFIKNDLALAAYHIPLDANNPYGNNFGLAARLGLKDCETFGSWRGMVLGVKGQLEKELTIEEVAKKISRPGKSVNHIIALGKDKIKSVGIISGGASEDVVDAAEEGLDCYITGEFMHEDYHIAEEYKINVIAGGHYETETVGVSLVMEKVQKELGIDCFFIDEPTGL
ncbi:MAG: Nif3-like dinuclear metal center hexameric protein [Treponema sp.]|nr:Nif3-like dinuclear metal center hexameric protein [Treponema sp.]